MLASGGGGMPAIQRSTSLTGALSFSARGVTPPKIRAANSNVRETGVRVCIAQRALYRQSHLFGVAPSVPDKFPALPVSALGR
jgi:carbamate kinase